MDRKAVSSRRAGTVLMEYVVLTCFVSVVVLVFLQHAVHRGGVPVSGFYNVREGYVGLGVEWASNVQRLHRAIALPLP